MSATSTVSNDDLEALFDDHGAPPALSFVVDTLRMSAFPNEPLEASPEYRDLVRDSADAGKLVVIGERRWLRDQWDIDVYVAPPHELWRVSALVIIGSAERASPRGFHSEVIRRAEMMMRGCTHEEFEGWLAHRDRRRVQLGSGPTIYMLATESYCSEIQRLGGRSLPPDVNIDDFVIFQSRSNRPIRDNIDDIIKDRALLRMSVQASYLLRVLFPVGSQQDLARCTSRPSPVAINANLGSNIERHVGNSWHELR